MIKFAAFVLLGFCIGCSILAPIAGGAVGATAGAAIAGPGGAAGGAAIGVATAQAAFPDEDVSDAVALEAAKQGNAPPGSGAELVEKITDLLSELGWWYLILFVLVPFMSERCRKWMKQKVLPKKQ